MGEHHQLSAVAGAELRQKVADVCLDRRVADDEPHGDLEVGETVGHGDQGVVLPGSAPAA